MGIQEQDRDWEGKSRTLRDSGGEERNLTLTIWDGTDCSGYFRLSFLARLFRISATSRCLLRSSRSTPQFRPQPGHRPTWTSGVEGEEGDGLCRQHTPGSRGVTTSSISDEQHGTTYDETQGTSTSNHWGGESGDPRRREESLFVLSRSV